MPTIKLYLMLLLAVVFSAVCTSKGDAEALQSVLHYTGTPADGNPKLYSALEKRIDSAADEIQFVVSDFEDDDLAQALAASKASVFGAVDYQSATDTGIVRLAQNEIDTSKNELGFVGENFLVADGEYCVLSSGGFSPNTFTSGYSFGLSIRSPAFCITFVNEARQMTEGSIFSDTGEESFGKWRTEKSITKAVHRFVIDEFVVYIFFGAQERPLTFMYEQMMRATSSIRFISSGLTQNIINDATDHDVNRSHFVNVLSYKRNISDELDKEFLVQGIVDDRFIGDSDDCSDNSSLSNPTSIHCDLRNLLTGNMTKYTAEDLNLNLVLIDEESDTPMLIFMSSDMHLIGGFDVTDAFVIGIQPNGTNVQSSLFKDVGALFDTIFKNGEAVP